MSLFFLTHASLQSARTNHGGVARAEQIHELMSEVASVTDVVAPAPERSRTPSAVLEAAIRGANPLAPAPLRRFLSLRHVFRTGVAVRCARTLEEAGFGSGDILVVDATFASSYPVVSRALRLGGRVIVASQNLDSLVPGYVHPLTGAPSRSWFGWEMKKLAEVNRVVTISREEQWLLRLWGIDAEYLPYYPPRARLERLRAIRARRVNATRDMLLVMGSATNPPTALGLQELARFMRDNPDWLRELQFVVVGNGVDDLAHLFPDRVQVMGRVDEETMANLWVDARACLVHQRPTTGALTRIPELLVAGVPVIASSAAARSVYGLDGVDIYEQFGELSLDSVAHLPTPPEPTPPLALARRFQSLLRSA